MTEQEILTGLTRILQDLLSADSITLSMETTRDEVPNWDSFTYISFIVAVEMRYGLKFGVAEVESFPSVGAIVRRIGAILSARQQPVA
jgi:acyl carrier protein